MLKEPSAGEREARQRLERIVAAVTADDIRDFDTRRDLFVRIFREVAEAFHPGKAEPILEVTLPELLRALELTSRDLRRDLLRVFPASRDVTVRAMDVAMDLNAWFVALAPLASSVGRAGHLLVNPVDALAREAITAVAGLSLRRLGPELMKRVAQIVAQRSGETAILLYGGHCRVEHDHARRPRAGAPGHEAPRLRVAVVGQVNAGKSSLINALAGRAVSLSGHTVHTAASYVFALEVPGPGPVELVDTPGLRHGAAVPVDDVVGADMVLWVVALHRADRAPDAALAAAIRASEARNRQRRLPPVIVVPTHMDRLDAAGAWQPPYDWQNGSRPRELAARAAVATVREALGLEEALWAPAMLRDGNVPWNLEAVTDAMTSARRQAEMALEWRRHATRTWWDRTVAAAHTAAGVGGVLKDEARRLLRVRRGGDGASA